MSGAVWEIRQGHVLDLLSEIESGTVQTCVTSPPYHGLRAYGTEPQVWGGDPACDHEWKSSHRRGIDGGPSEKQLSNPGSRTSQGWTVAFCVHCGAWLGELGSEPSVDCFVSHLVGVFREVRRTLRDDGTCWLNLGDSYSGSGKGPTTDASTLANGRGAGVKTAEQRQGFFNRCSPDVALPPKNLQMVPWRLALALQDDGWIVRSVIVWAKRAPMPESVTDRPTSSWEPIFLLSKHGRYFYDQAAVSEPATHAGEQLGIVRGTKRRAYSMGVEPSGNEVPGADADIGAGRNQRNVWEIPHDDLTDFWKLSPEPFPGAHFAVMPTEIARRAILAGSKPGDLILDPFAGSGTVPLVANRLGRRGLGLELNPAYAQMARNRIQSDSPLMHAIALAAADPRARVQRDLFEVTS